MLEYSLRFRRWRDAAGIGLGVFVLPSETRSGQTLTDRSIRSPGGEAFLREASRPSEPSTRSVSQRSRLSRRRTCIREPAKVQVRPLQTSIVAHGQLR